MVNVGGGREINIKAEEGNVNGFIILTKFKENSFSKTIDGIFFIAFEFASVTYTYLLWFTCIVIILKVSTN